jgi:hypothetical protein
MNMIALNESSPEKAGVGGSIPSLATTFSITYSLTFVSVCSISFQNPIWAFGLAGNSTRREVDHYA